MSEQWDGVPENPERDGWHWLLRLAGEKPGVWFWDADAQGWRPALLAEDFVKHLTYLGPCLTPAEVAAVVQAEHAACERLAVAAEAMPRATPAPGDSGTPHQFTIEAGVVWELDMAIRRYRARGDTSALDAAIQAAEARGMERAAQIAKRFGAKSRASRTVARVASKHLHAQLWDASADAAHDIEAAIRASITAAQGDGS